MQEITLCTCRKPFCHHVEATVSPHTEKSSQQNLNNKQSPDSTYYGLASPDLMIYEIIHFLSCLNTLSWGYLLLIGSTILTDTYSYDQVLSLHVVYNFIDTK